MKVLDHLSRAFFIQILVIFILLILSIVQIRTWVTGYKPEYVQIVDEKKLADIIKNETRLIFLFMYTSPKTDLYRDVMPRMDEIAKLFRTQVRFVGYQPAPPDPKDDQAQPPPKESWLILIKNGKTIRQEHIVVFNTKIAMRGFLFTFIKNDVTLPELPSSVFTLVPTTALNPNNFDRLVLRSPKPIIVSFFTPFDPNSQMLQSNIDQLSSTYAGLLDFYSVDVSDSNNVKLRNKYNIRTTPQLLVFHEGREQGRIKGTYGGLAGDEAGVLGLYLQTLY